MKTGALAWLLLLLALPLWVGCDADQENPFDDTDKLDFDWPSSDPNRYHWDGLRAPFFEGWFFRVVAPGGRAYAFIYAVQNPGAGDADDGGAYLVAFRSGGELVQGAFALEEFTASRQALDVTIDGNTATPTRLSGRLLDEGVEVVWDLNIELREAWDDTMGSLTNTPLLPVNWHVGMLRAEATGTIEWDGQTEVFQAAPIFQDHNWGDFFPDSYVWLQSQEFADPDGALALAGGEIGAEPGMFVWRHAGELVELRSQDFDATFRFTPDAAAGRVDVEIRSGDRLFTVTGFFADDTPAVVPAPRPSGFLPFTHMALAGRVRVLEYFRDGVDWLLVREVWSKTAGVEIGGAYWSVSAE